MIHTIKKAITVFSLVVFGSALLYNCEPDADTLGEQLFLDGAAQGHEEALELTAFNIDNKDSIRSDAGKLGSAILGAFDENKFGMQKASYVTQLRLSTYDPDFGTNAVVDSVVLVIKPTYASDSIATNTVDDNYNYTTVDGDVAAKKVVNTYPVLKFGKAKRTFNLRVNEVDEFLKGPADSAKSNHEYTATTLLGTKEFKGSISSVTITKDSDGSALFTASTPGIRMQLDKTFFQNKIIAKKGQPELKDASNFIRYFKGLRISVDENDGYLFQISPNDTELIMYYKYDKTDNGTTTRPQTTYTFAMGSANAHIGEYKYDRLNSAWSNATIGDQNNGAPKLYLQGMGGPSIGVKIPDATINQLKDYYKNKKAGIITAKIRIYTDKTSWANTNYAKPTAFTFIQRYKDASSTTPNKTLTSFTNDVLKLASIPGYTIYKSYNLDKDEAYYEFVVTQSVKDLVETETATSVSNATKYFRIDMGSFLSNSDGTGLAGAKYTSTAYNTNRAVFVGSEAGNAKRVQLMVTYGTK